MRWTAGFFSALFALAAVLQWNDPDPLLWILGYGFAAVLSGIAASGRDSWWPNAVAALVFIIWFATLAPSLPGAPGEAFQSFSMQETSHEEPREAVGLALAAAWSAALAIWAWRRRSGSEVID